jgi:hypothetical protein
MKPKKRGALETSALTKIILALALFVVLVTFFSGALNLFAKSEDDLKCRLTVLAQQLKPTGTSLVSLSCPRHNLKITETGVQTREIDGKWKPMTKFDNPLEKDVNQFYKLAADEMADCWFRLGEGKINVFNKDGVAIAGRQTCMICSQIQFDRSPELKLGTSGDFLKYLNDNNYTKNEKNVRYNDYMVKVYPPQFSDDLWSLYLQSEKTLFVSGFETNDKLATSETYIIYFKAYKFTVFSDWTAVAFRKTMQTAGFERTNEAYLRADDTYYVFLSRPADVAKNCGILVN